MKIEGACHPVISVCPFKQFIPSSSSFSHYRGWAIFLITVACLVVVCAVAGCLCCLCGWCVCITKMCKMLCRCLCCCCRSDDDDYEAM